MSETEPKQPQCLNLAITSIDEILSFSSSWTQDQVIQFLYRDLLLLLQKAILSGEHFYGESSVGKLQDKITIELPRIIALLPDTTSENQRKWSDINIKKLEQIHFTVVEHYTTPFIDLSNFVSTKNSNLTDGKFGEQVNITKFLSYNIFQKVSTLFNLNNSPSLLPPTADAGLAEQPNKNQDLISELDHYYLYQINLLLAYLDYNLECSDEDLDILNDVILFLRSPKKPAYLTDLIQKLRDKAEILKYKIQYRLIQSRINDGATDEFIAINIPDIPKQNAFYQFVNEIQLHYKSDINVTQAEQECNSYSVENFQDIKLSNFHHLNRYYLKSKNFNPTKRSESIQALLNKIKDLVIEVSKEGSLISNSDKLSVRSVYKLVSNSKVKNILEISRKNSYKDTFGFIQNALSDILNTKISEGCNLKEIENHFPIIASIKKLSDNNSHPNFYCYYIYIEYLNGFLEFLIKNPDELITAVEAKNPSNALECIAKLVEFIKAEYIIALLNLRKKLETVGSYKVRPISLTESECIIPCKWLLTNEEEQEGVLFLYSSYILPIDFNQFHRKLQSWESFILPQINQLNGSLEIQFSRRSLEKSMLAFESQAKEKEEEHIGTINKHKDDFDKQVRSNEFKVVQIVAMFVSIATFVLLNVKIFDNKTAWESFGIILGLAGCFFIFNLFFHILVTSKIHGTKNGLLYAKRILVLIVAPVLLTAIGLVVIYQERGTETRFKELLKKDSINSILLDSIYKKVYKRG